MKKVVCPYCGHLVKMRFGRCPVCGKILAGLKLGDLVENPIGRTGRILLIGGGLFALFMFLKARAAPPPEEIPEPGAPPIAPFVPPSLPGIVAPDITKFTSGWAYIPNNRHLNKTKKTISPLTKDVAIYELFVGLQGFNKIGTLEKGKTAKYDERGALMGWEKNWFHLTNLV